MTGALCVNCRHPEREHCGTRGGCLYEYPRGSVREGYICSCLSYVPPAGPRPEASS